MNWRTLKVIGIHIMLACLILEFVTKQDIFFSLDRIGAICILIAANMRLNQLRKRRSKK